MSGTITWAAFAMGSSLVLLLGLILTGRRSRVDERLDDLIDPNTSMQPGPVAGMAKAALPKMGAALMPVKEESQQRLRARLVHAGLYKRHAMAFFMGVKMFLAVAPALIGVALSTVGVLPISKGVLYGAFTGLVGTLAPSMWLDRQKRRRQSELRRALPDALDVIVICLEGGLSLPSSFSRVSSELRSAHPLLAMELNIVQREIQLGRSTGEALREFADRFDVAELRSLSSVVLQAERFGASVVKALRVHADGLRLKRQQRAEEMAHKAGTKLIFPTLLFIFPAMFVVVLAPAVYQILDVFVNTKH